MSGIRGVIFDHDGTLVDSEPITLGVVAEMAVEAGAEVYPEDIDRFVGADLKVVFAEIERRSGRPLPPDHLEQFRARQTTAINNGLQAVEGAGELLSALDLPVAVASNAPVAKMQLCLSAAGLRHHFTDDQLISAYDVGAWKPAPDVFLRAAATLGLAPHECAVVEDSRPGVEGALAAGMQVFALDPKGRFDGVTGATTIPNLSALIPLFG